jgi:hypothetical protein
MTWCQVRKPQLPMSGSSVLAYLYAGLYIISGADDRKFRLAIQILGTSNADSALKDCRVQVSRTAPISAVPVRSPASNSAGSDEPGLLVGAVPAGYSSWRGGSPGGRELSSVYRVMMARFSWVSRLSS